MEWLNYHHLQYFYVAAREGGVTRASEELRLAQSTISTQIRQLEHVLNERLFRREGRRLVLTDVGRVVYRYAEEIFGIGRELLDTVKGRPTGRPVRLTIGIADQMPKLIVYRLLEPALVLDEAVRLVCVEGKSEQLLTDLALHRLDVVLTDAPLGPAPRVRAFNHLLGECGITFFAVEALARRFRGRFPQSLDRAPMLMPTEGSTLRRSLDHWLGANDVRPQIVAEFDDSALLKAFGQAGRGVFPGPTAIEREICRQYTVKVLGRTTEVKERFYAISVERRLTHPAVLAISQAAKAKLFD
jgi:LysR family transcriptional regulator, transcriptional activator of nhaA